MQENQGKFRFKFTIFLKYCISKEENFCMGLKMNFPLKNEWRDFNFKRFENEEFHLNLGEMEGNLLIYSKV